MNARTLIITAGAIVALAAPTVANARMLPVKQPSKHFVKKHAAKPNVTKRQGQPLKIYIYVPAPLIQAQTSLEQLQQEYNDDLVAHGLAPIDFGQTSTPDASETPSSAPEATSSASETPSSDVPSEAAPASFAASSTSDTVTSTATEDDC